LNAHSSVSDFKVLPFVLSFSCQDDLARENSERRDAAVAKVVQQDQRSTSGRGGRGRGRGGGETSAAEKKTSLRGLVRTQAESTLAHSKQPTLSVRTRPEGKQETVSRIISVLSNAVFTQWAEQPNSSDNEILKLCFNSNEMPA